MFPVSLLAFMGLLLGIGSSVTSPSTITSFPFLGGEFTQLTFGFIAMVGGFAFTYLPLMFAMAIPWACQTQQGGRRLCRVRWLHADEYEH